jgi:hypothetical protein
MMARAWVWVRRRTWIPGVLVALIVAGQLTSRMAGAEEKKEFTYPYKWVFKSTYRLIKIDMGCPIEEVDKESGFILFTYTYQGVESPASIELMDLGQDDESYHVNSRVVMNKLPSWVEEDLLDQLSAKLVADYGEPPKPKPKPKAKPEPPPEDEKPAPQPEDKPE